MNETEKEAALLAVRSNDELGAAREENARLKAALEKIANSTCHEAQCWPLHKIAQDALREIVLDELTAQSQELNMGYESPNVQIEGRRAGAESLSNAELGRW